VPPGPGTTAFSSVFYLRKLGLKDGRLRTRCAPTPHPARRRNAASDNYPPRFTSAVAHAHHPPRLLTAVQHTRLYPSARACWRNPTRPSACLDILPVRWHFFSRPYALNYRPHLSHQYTRTTAGVAGTVLFFGQNCSHFRTRAATLCLIPLPFQRT